MPEDKIKTLKPRPQLGALPWRRVDGQIEILMVTSRISGRWLIPKGWPMRGKRHAEAAAIEAFEEAGVKGRTSPAPVGKYSYAKQLPNGEAIPCEVEVYALEVLKELENWPEAAARRRRWMRLGEACAEAYEPGLAELLRSLDADAFQWATSSKAKR